MARTVARADRVTAAELQEFITARHHVVLTTRRADGSPQMSPVTAGTDAEGRVLVATYPERAKVHNLRRDPTVSLLVLSDDWNGAWVQLDGTCEVLDLPDALDEFVTYFRVISGEHPDWAEYRQAMLDQGKCLLRITPTRWGPVATGGFPARLVDDA